MQARLYRTTVISSKELVFILEANSISISFLIFYVNQKLFCRVFISDQRFSVLPRAECTVWFWFDLSDT